MASESSPVKVAAVGDIFPGDHYFSIGHGVMSRTQAGNHDIFGSTNSTLQAADITIGNLEGPLCSTSTQSSSVGAATFRGIPAFGSLLKNAGFTHVNVANNHIMQHGAAAFSETVESLHTAGIIPVGLRGHKSGQVSSPVVETCHGTTVCLVGYSQVPERYSRDPLYAHFTDHRPVADEISRLSRQYDHVIVSCHAGEEGISTPAPQVITMYNEFVAAGARCVLGHHSHVFQPIAYLNGRLIAYSLGNFVFDLFWDKNAVLSAILEINIDAARVSHVIHPTYFTRNYSVAQGLPNFGTGFLSNIEAMSTHLAVGENNYRSLVNAHERQNQRKKYLYFLQHITEGNTRLKMSFLARKLTGRL